jgi:hypothetical protein
MGAVGSLDDSLTVSGLRTDRYTLQPAALAELSWPGAAAGSSVTPQTTVDFNALHLIGRTLVGRGDSGTTPCLVSQWRASTPTSYDWNASVEVLRHGQWAAPQDSVVLDDRQLPTSLWPPEHAGAAFTSLNDPPRPLDASTAHLVLMKLYARSGEDAALHPASDALVGMLEPDGEGVALADYDIDDIPRIFDEPALELSARVDAEFPGVGTLIGIAVHEPDAQRGAPPVSLLWRASATPDTSYTVFVHLIAPDGQIVAQSDSPPDGGYRRTTTWLAGEYILEARALNVNDATYAGSASFRVGLYDAQTGRRVPTQGGEEYVVLPISVQVDLR